MTATLEDRVSLVERTLSELQQLLAHPARPSGGIMSLAGTMADFPEFQELTAHGLYIRKTGQLPPPDWKPGDPIPEPVE